MRSLRSYFITTLLRVMFKRQKPGAKPVQQMRDEYARAMARSYKPQPGVTCQADTLGAVAGEWSRPVEFTGQRTVLYLHGGGYAIGCAAAYRDLAGRLALAGQANVFAADYRLAPEHQYPAARDDALLCYRALLADGIPASAITIAGDSAGGGLTLATLVALRDAGDPLPGAVVCLSPWSDLTGSGESVQLNAKADPFITIAALAYMAKLYAGDAPLSDPGLSPCFADLSGLPPMLIQVGSTEILLDDSRRVVEKITAAGGNATIDIWKGMPHVWHLFAPQIPEGRQAIDQLSKFVLAHTGN